MNDVMKIIRSLEESGLLIKGVCDTIKNEVKELKEVFLNMLLGILGASLLEDLLTGKCTTRAGESTIRADQDFQCHLILKYKSIIKTNPNFVVFTQEIIFLK